MKHTFYVVAAALLALHQAAAAPATHYINDSSVLNPHVNAIHFLNRGLFQASGLLPYETFNTLTFSNEAGLLNSGVMWGSPGFWFNHNDGHVRTWADTFFSDNNAVVEAFSGSELNVPSLAVIGPSYLRIWATNIIVKAGVPSDGSPGSRASLIVSPNGTMELLGRNVDISRAGLEVKPVWNQDQVLGSANDIQNGTFTPDIAVHDLASVEGQFGAPPNTLATAGLWNGTAATSVNAPPSGNTVVASFTLDAPQSDYYIGVDPFSGGAIVVTNYIPVISPEGFVADSTNTFLTTNIVILPPDYFETNTVFTTNFSSLEVIVGLMDENPGNGPSNENSTNINELATHQFDLTELTNVVVLTNRLITGLVFEATENTTTYAINTNLTKGAVFVQAPPGFTVVQGFSGGGEARTINVGIGAPIVNAVTLETADAWISISDALAASGDRGLLNNTLTTVPPGDGTTRPANYVVSRQTPTGSAINNPPPDDFFLSSSIQDPASPFFVEPPIFSVDAVTNATVQAGDYAGYEAFFDNIVIRPPDIASAVISNVSGRITIDADRLNMELTRIRGEGLVQIGTPHLISSSVSTVDAENLSFDLASTNGTLAVENMASETVNRLRGSVTMWSAVWENTVEVRVRDNFSLTNGTTIITNIPAGTTNEIVTTNLIMVQTTLTNFFSVRYHTLMVDARNLTTILPVNVYDLVTRSPNVFLNDNMSVIQSLFIDGASLTINGTLTIPGSQPPNPVTGFVPVAPPLINWRATNTPNLFALTNAGALLIAGEAHFGDDRPLPLESFVNAGSLSAFSFQARARNFEQRGTLFSSAFLNIEATDGLLIDSFSRSSGESRFRGENLRLSNYQVYANGAVTFVISNLLTDLNIPSHIETGNGINLLVKPRMGDLLQTEVLSFGPEVPAPRPLHVWAAEDRGPTAAGFTDNAALGILRLVNLGLNPIFTFRGTGAQNALYVDLLDLSTLDNIESQIRIDPNMRIYFASAALGFDPPVDDTNAPPQTPEEYLDGKFGGRLRWVPTYAGSNSSVIVGDQPVNIGLAQSAIIDSDNDGTPNRDDETPFTFAPISIQVLGNGTVALGQNPQMLIVGQTYNAVAQPAEGSDFIRWSGSVPSESRQISFVMESGLELVAEFTFNPVAATYSGLFYESDEIRFLQSGSITITTTTQGKYSGKIQIGSSRYSFSGVLGDAGEDAIDVGGGLFLEFQAGIDEITGIIDTSEWTATFVADRTGFNKKTSPAPFAGQYTILFPGTNDAQNVEAPFGYGYGTIKVDEAGKVKLSGTLADGTKISQTTVAAQNGSWALYVPLYKDGGHLLGWQTFRDIGVQDVGGSFSWIKDAVGGKNYPDGFNLMENAVGSMFSPTNVPLSGFENATLFMSGGGLASPIFGELFIDGKSKATGLNGQKLNLTIKKTGMFTGSVLNPATNRQIKFQGAVLQKQQFGGGFFLNEELSGRVQLDVLP